MKAVVQRVKNACVSVDNKVCGSIKHGLLVYLGVGIDDLEKDADWMIDKIINLRIFDDADGKMNLSIIEKNQGTEQNYGLLLVSQFTLFGDVKKGRRPSYTNAAPPEKAKKMYSYFVGKIKDKGLICQTGIFQAMMEVTYTNDGPVTILIDSK
jgi:D-tyrosyl-tRNA(Tyr) deacylase